ncbi:MAG TPA: hypothetical protein QF821_02830 [Candidatus Thalassarchaeaceae archaeon]|nr:hypothetical protein [Candidatus Thalassarchaeaceae archaeon]
MGQDLVVKAGCRPWKSVAQGAWAENDRSRVFLNASRLALRDGQLSNGEKRILVKLAHALSLGENEPKRIYDAILSGEDDQIRGDMIEKSEMRLVYGQVLEAMLIHTDRSDDVLAQIAYLRRMFLIEDAEHRAIARSLDRQLEEIVHRSFIDEYRMRLNDSVDNLREIFDSVNILSRKQ